MNEERALEDLIAEYPRADLQQLRALIRNARREAETGKPAKSFRELFHVLREVMARPD
jgi:ribosome-associated protein